MKPTRRRRWRVLWITCAALVLGALAVLLRPVEVFRQISYARLWLSGAESRYVTVRNCRLHYQVLGPKKGAVVVLVHGLGGRGEDWRKLSKYLVGAGYRVYLPDLPGFGRSEQPADFSYSIADQAGVVIDFFDAVGLVRPDLGGWSMGGWVVQMLAAQHPERVRKLLLFDSAGVGKRPDWDTELFTPQSRDDLNRWQALLTPHPVSIPAFVARDIVRVSNRNAWVTRRAVTSMLTGRDVMDARFAELTMPVLLVWGALDHVTPLDQGQTMHRLLPRSQLEVLDGCGHLAPAECASQAGPKVVAFLASAP